MLHGPQGQTCRKVNRQWDCSERENREASEQRPATLVAETSSRAEPDAPPPSPTISQGKKTYTPAQLRNMVQGGNYPKQGTPKVETVEMNFVTCLLRVEAIMDAAKPNYPTATVVNTQIMHLSKAWTNDGAVTATCSAADNKLIVTVAPYL
jgi:hypothetical protein